MKILIIGSKGFIGRYCVDYFKQHHQVWQCDVVVDYTTPQYTQVDATNANYNDIFINTNFDVCVNCSGAASVPDSIQHPERDFNLNTVNVFKQLEAIRKYNPTCKYINLSSAAVYGNPQSLPVKEEHLLQPISPYGKHKKMAEDICQEFYDIYNISTCNLRLFSAYGNGLYKQLFWDLHKKAQKNQTVELFGTGEEQRDFIHVKDVVKAISCVVKNADFKNNIINVANGEAYAIKEVVRLFYKAYPIDVIYNFSKESRQGDPLHWKADISKLIQLGYQPSMTIEEGLKAYVRWVQDQK